MTPAANLFFICQVSILEITKWCFELFFSISINNDVTRYLFICLSK